MNVNEDIIERIRKCLNLANGLNATPGEMEAAMTKAKEIAMRYNIDLATVDMEGEEKPVLDVDKDDTLRIRSEYEQPYHRYIYHILMSVFGVRIVTHTSSCYGGKRVSRITLIGEVTDVAICREIFPWLEKIFPRSLSREVSAGRLTYRAAHTHGWYGGLAKGIVAANKRAEEKLSHDDKNKWALVVRSKSDMIDSMTKALFPHLKNPRKSRTQYDWEAHSRGYQVGSQIRLGQMGGPSSSSSLKG